MKADVYLLGRIRILFSIAVVLAFFTFYLYLYTDTFSSHHEPKISFGNDKVIGNFAPSPKHHPAKETLRSLFLTKSQCASTFPGLFKEIDRAVNFGPFVLNKGPDDYSGAVQGRIKDGKLYIIQAQRDNVLTRIGAILHSLHRAIITSPEPVPNTVFILNINDEPRANAWSFSRSNDDFIVQNPWLMPHFSTWSWPLQYLGPVDQALDKAGRIEQETPFEKKIDKAVWRGTPWFNPLWSLGLRPKLLEKTKEKDWADVEIWNKDSNNTIPIVDMCKYKYIIYSEGKSYSGRLLYHQACASIIITPPLTFLLHHTHLLRPLFSSTILDPTSDLEYSTPATKISWPISYPPTLANIIFVKPDWSDLEDIIIWLRANPEVAKRIAERQREMMVSGGYLSEAAEACYWRKLIRAWSETARPEPEDETWGEGLRWETFALTGSVKGFE